MVLAGTLALPVGLGLALSSIGGPIAVLVAAVFVAACLVWFAVTLPRPRQWRSVLVEVQFDPANGPAPCALCGYECLAGGEWTTVPGHMNAVMHTMGCGPVLPGEEPMADPTHRRELGGRYVQLDG